MQIASTIIDLAWAWGIAGAVTAAAFLTIGMGRIDEDARGAWIFRPLIAPGVMLLWPLVLWRWWVLETGRDDWRLRHAPPRRAHGRLWLAFAILIPLVFATALAVRQDWPAGIEPQRLDGGHG